jgi:hypothetical protein
LADTFFTQSFTAQDPLPVVRRLRPQYNHASQKLMLSPNMAAWNAAEDACHGDLDK